MTVAALDDAFRSLKADPLSRQSLEACIVGMVSSGRCGDHAARELLYLSARKQELSGLELAKLILSAARHEHRVVTLVGESDECQLKLGVHDVGIQGGTQHFPGACQVVAINGNAEYAFVAGRRLLIDMLMEPDAVLPPKEGVTPIWRARQIERFVDRAREIGLVAPPIDVDRLEETEPFGISYGDAMTDVRGGDAFKWSVARFRVLHRGLVYRCRFIRTSDPEAMKFEDPDFVECDPRFATAPSGSVRYVAPNPETWGLRGTCEYPFVTPFGHTVDHVRHGDMGLMIQTPYDLLSAVKAYSSAWLAGAQTSPAMFMDIVKILGMRGWFKADDNGRWYCVYERFGSTLDVSFHANGDGTVKAKLQYSFAGSDHGCEPVWVRTPRRLFEVVRDSFWIGDDGRERYRPGDVPPWIAAMREKRPHDDGIG